MMVKGGGGSVDEIWNKRRNKWEGGQKGREAEKATRLYTVLGDRLSQRFFLRHFPKLVVVVVVFDESDDDKDGGSNNNILQMRVF